MQNPGPTNQRMSAQHRTGDPISTRIPRLYWRDLGSGLLRRSSNSRTGTRTRPATQPLVMSNKLQLPPVKVSGCLLMGYPEIGKTVLESTGPKGELPGWFEASPQPDVGVGMGFFSRSPAIVTKYGRTGFETGETYEVGAFSPRSRADSSVR